jgi:hypothetical protein
VEINNDGLLDIYICRVGKYEVLNSKNQFLICKGIDKNGVPFYEDEAKHMAWTFQGSAHKLFFLVRHIRKIAIAGKDAFILGRNNDSLMVIKYR